MSKPIEIDFQENVELPITAFPPFKLRSSMVDRDPVIWVHLIEVYITYIQTIIQLKAPLTTKSEQQLCLFVKTYLSEIADEQNKILSLGLINVQITENLNILRIWILELVKQIGILNLKMSGETIWNFAKIYALQNTHLVRDLIDGSFKPIKDKSKTINSISFLHKHLELLIGNDQFDPYNFQILTFLINDKFTSIGTSDKSSIKKINKSINKESFGDKFVTISWLEILEKFYSNGEGRFHKISQELGVLSLLSISTNKLIKILTELSINSYHSLKLYPLIGGILTNPNTINFHPQLYTKLPFLKIEKVNSDDINTLIGIFPDLSLHQATKFLQKYKSIDQVTNLLLESPDLITNPSASSSTSSRHVLTTDSIEPIQSKRINIPKKFNHVPDEHRNKTLTAALRLLYENDEDERDDTYDDAETTTGNSTDPKESKFEAIESLLWEIFKKNPESLEKTNRNSSNRKNLKKTTGWSDEQIEGWFRMLQKSPKRVKLLEEKYLFKGNKPWNSSFNKQSDQDQPQNDHDETGKVSTGKVSANDKHDSKPSQSNQGNKNGDKKTFARNEKNKASRANHNRKLGHDKKLSRAG